MFKSKKQNNASLSGVITGKAGLSRLTVVIIVIAVIVLLLGTGAAATYIGHVGPFAPKTTSSSTSTSTTTTPTTATAAAHQESVKQAQGKIDTLVQAGGGKSVAEADQVADSEVATANSSGDDAYIVSAGLAKAVLLITTDRAQEALDSVLLPLDQKYGSNEAYRYDIYGSISWAYRQLNNQAKADEYFNMIPSKGFD